MNTYARLVTAVVLCFVLLLWWCWCSSSPDAVDDDHLWFAVDRQHWSKHDIITHECSRVHSAYNNYDVFGQCPSEQDYVATAQSLPHCPWLETRRCISPIPPNYSHPSLNSSERLWGVPLNSAVDWRRYSPFSSWEQLALRGPGEDCRTCFQFEVERRRWRGVVNSYIAVIGKTRWKGVRTALDVGPGAGGFCAEMSQYGIQCLSAGLEVNSTIPYHGFISARGLLVIQHNVEERLHLPDDAVDFLHSERVLNVVRNPKRFQHVLMDWDRVLRPGGYLAFQFWESKRNGQAYSLTEYVSALDELVRLLAWRQLSRKLHPPEILCVYQKPLFR